MRRLLEVPGEIRGVSKQLFLVIKGERCLARSRRQRMPGIRVTVEELDPIRTLHEGIIDVLASNDSAHGDCRARHALRERNEIGHDVEVLRSECLAQTSESRNALVEDQQNAVFVANRPQPLEIALGRDNDARRTLDRLDDDGRDVRRVVQCNDTFQIVRKVCPPVVLGAAKCDLFAIVVMG